jgi:hypothetical protein
VSGVERKGPPKPRPHPARKKKRRKAARNWGRIAMWTALVLWVIAIVLFVVLYVRHASKARSTASAERSPVPIAWAQGFAAAGSPGLVPAMLRASGQKV